MKNLNGKKIIVTGASKGIGREIAIQLANAGAQIAIHYNSDHAGAEQTLAQIKNPNGGHFTVQANLNDSNDIKNLFTQVKAKWESIDGLINNAGIYHFGPFQMCTKEQIHEQLQTNVFGVIDCVQNALPFLNTKGASIVNISSVATTKPTPYTAVYTATKAAINGFTESLAQELGAQNIRVNAILPGPTLTEGTRAIGLDQAEQVAEISSKTALKRMGTVEDIAKAVCFLCSEESRFITGQKIEVSGGF